MTATPTPIANVASPARMNVRSDAVSPELACRETTTTITPPFGNRAGAAANTRLPLLPLTGCRFARRPTGS